MNVSPRRSLVAALSVLALAAAPLGASQSATAAPPRTPASAAVQQLLANPALQIPGWDTERFAEPGEAKPAVLWFWNRMQTEAQVDQTLEEMHAAGFTQTVIFRMDTAPNPPQSYFSEAWFDRVEDVLEKSDELGMKVWLSNDYQFPSGAAGGYVVDGGTVGDTTYEPRPDLGVKTAVRSGNVVVGGGQPIDLPGLFGSSVQLVDGQVVADASAIPGITLLEDSAAWTDYTVSAEFTIEAGTAGFMVRSPDKLNGILVDVRRTGHVDFWKQIGGAFQPIRFGTPPAGGFDPTGPHTISIKAVGNQIDVVLDGTPIAPVTDSSFPAGGVGLRVDGAQKWRLDELSVGSEPSGTSLFSNDFSDPASVGAFDVAVTPLRNVVAIAARPASGPGATDVDQVVELTDTYGGSGTWDAPAGTWRVEAFTYRLKGDNYADTLSTEAMELYDEIIMGEYHDRFAWAFGDVLAGFADDEPSLTDRYNGDAVPWTPELTERLQSRGVEVGRAMVSTFADMGRKGSTYRGHLYQAANDQFVDAYWKTKYTWAEDHGISIISNPLHDELGPVEELRHSGNLMTAHQWAQVPGTDLIGFDQAGGRFRHVGRTASSVAHQLGRPLVYNEMLGAMDWHISLDHVREATASQAVRGVNFALFHTTYDEIEGIPYPPVFMEENTWWPWMSQVNEWTGRVMEFGRHTTMAPTALLQMSRSIEATQRAAADGSDQAYLSTVHSLEDSQVDFDVLDEGALSDDPQVIAQAEVRDGALRVGEMTYTTVVVPSAAFLSLEAARTLRDLVADGGEVVWSGAVPTQEFQGRDAELATTIAEIGTLGGDRVVAAATPAGAGRAAAGLGQSAVELSVAEPGVRALRFTEDGTDGYLLLNESRRTVTVDVTFPSSGVPAIWDPETGDVTEATVYRDGGNGTVVVPMTLDPRAPLGVTFSPDTGPAGGRTHLTRTIGAGDVVSTDVVDGALTATVRSERNGQTLVRGTGGGTDLAGVVTTTGVPDAVTLDGPWTMALENGSAPVTRPLAGWTDLAPSYSGSATYTRQVDLTADQLDGVQWELDLGRVGEVAQVKVNGEAVGERVWAPFVVDLGSALRAGANTIEVRVTNTDANARGNNPVASGLFGPVSLVPSVTDTVALAETTVAARGLEAAMNEAGTVATVSLDVANTGTQPVTGTVVAVGPDGWTTRSSAPVTVPAGGTASGAAQLFPGGIVDDGVVPVEARFVVDGTTVDGTTGSLDASFATPPAGATDHVDLGDGPSEQAHGLTASPTSGTNTEAGLTRRYAGDRVPGAWYEFDLAVTAGQGFVLQGRDTYDGSGARRNYSVIVDGQVAGVRDHTRTSPGVAGYRLHVPAALVTRDRVRVRVQTSNIPGRADPSLADVWALPSTDDVEAPTVAATVSSARPGEAGWHRAPARVTLTATDDRDANPTLEWGIGADWQPYDAPVAVEAEGLTTVSHRATDLTGNRSAAGAVEVRIDSVAPETTVTSQVPGGVPATGRATITLAATDATSGVAATRYRLDGSAWSSYDGSPVAVQGFGRHVVEVASTDVAGNVEATRAVTVDLRDVDRISAVVAPQVTGPARVGARLTSTTGSWNTGGLGFARQWLRNGAPIARATGVTYVLGAADVGKRISVRVTASKPTLASGTSTSAATAPVAKATSTARATVNKATVKKGKPVKVTAVVAANPTATGRVAVVVNGRTVKTLTLKNGRAATQVRIAKRGKARIVVRYLGSAQVAPSTSPVRTVRVR